MISLVNLERQPLVYLQIITYLMFIHRCVQAKN